MATNTINVATPIVSILSINKIKRKKLKIPKNGNSLKSYITFKASRFNQHGFLMPHQD
jgi:hypothetical protein